MGKQDFEIGSATEEQYLDFLNERQAIWHRRFVQKLPWPWTADPILREFKFTNIFRELDAGTIWLRQNLKETTGAETLQAVALYRMINNRETFEECGFDIEAIRRRSARGDKVFTSAHLTVGVAGEPKLETTIKTLEKLSGVAFSLALDMQASESLRKSYDMLIEGKFLGIGPFIAYEIITDLRWTRILSQATDTLTWANIGPGAKRGLLRLGLDPQVSNLRYLWHFVKDKFQRPDCPHPFELREIEHSLCEFDKYCRGSSRQRYEP